MKVEYLVAIIIVLLTVGTALNQGSGYAIADNEQIVTTIFNGIMKIRTELNGQFTVLDIHRVDYHQKKIYVTIFSHEVPTLDKKFLLLAIEATWEISDFIKYKKNLSDFNEAKNLVWDSAEKAVRRVIIKYEHKDVFKITGESVEKFECSRDIVREIIKLTNKNISRKGLEIINMDIKLKKQPSSINEAMAIND